MRKFSVLLVLWCSAAAAQALDNGALEGDYHFVHLLARVGPSAAVEDVQNLSGTVTFDGSGAFAFNGMLGSGADAPAPASGGGAYSVAPNGFVVLDNPNANVNLLIEARLGEAAEILIGASTEGRDGSIDFFVAVKAPASAVNAAALEGEYTGAGLGFLNGSDQRLASTLLSFRSSGDGSIPLVEVLGHAADVAGDVNFEEEIENVTYAINPDGTGTADFREGFGVGSGLFFGDHDIFVSAGGAYLIGSSREKSGRQVFVAIKRLGDDAAEADWAGDYWVAEIGADLAEPTRRFTSSVGAVRSSVREGRGTASAAKRVREISPDTAPTGAAFDRSGRERFRIDPDSRGCLGPCEIGEQVNMAIGAAGDGAPRAFVGARVDVRGVRDTRHGVFFGVRMLSLSGSGVFLNPLGVMNGASFAPPTFPVAPGAIVSLFGTGLAPDGTDARAEATPLPVTLAGVSVMVNDFLAPLFSVSPGQINILIPFATNGAAAVIRVSNNGVLSNAVEARLAPASPGVFSVDSSGAGRGIVTHADFSLVTAEHPAEPGEVVSLFLTGLGAVSPPVPDGAAAPADPLSRVVDAANIVVRFDGGPAGEVLYAGLAPHFVGLYQLNVRIPDEAGLEGDVAVSIETSRASTSFVDLAIHGPE